MSSEDVVATSEVELTAGESEDVVATSEDIISILVPSTIDPESAMLELVPFPAARYDKTRQYKQFWISQTCLHRFNN